MKTASTLRFAFALALCAGCGDLDAGQAPMDPAAGDDPGATEAVAAQEAPPAVVRVSRPLTAGALAERIRGRIVCASPDGAGSTDMSLAEVPVVVAGFATTATTSGGAFAMEGPYFGGAVAGRVSYEGAITGPGTTAATTLRIMDDVQATRSDGFTASGTIVPAPVSTPGAGASLDLGVIRLATAECEIWRMSRIVVQGFHATRGAAMPRGRVGVMRRAGVWGTTPYAFYDYVDLATNFLALYPARFNRQHTMFHEIGHVIRDVADGDAAHWHWDNTRIRYARGHDGTEISEDAYAFHEGWAGYWAIGQQIIPGNPSFRRAAVHTPAHLDWVENLVANRLLDLAACVGDRAMVQTLEANPGTIHSLHQFETRLCTGRSCCGMVRAAPAACPPSYINDGLTCRLDNIRAKPSYGRGAGTVPTSCGAGRQNDAGLCYPLCAAGYSGVGPVCWQQCPAGYNDDGAFCRRDAHIFGSDNSACPWYDVCGVTFARGCSVCPAGYQNDGCTCRRDAHIFAKSSYGRGVGTVPTSCGAGRQNDAGLCYPLCAAGFTGVGPVCWGSCPTGYADHGATCYRDPHIISRFP
jgi:hypothetical protein